MALLSLLASVLVIAALSNAEHGPCPDSRSIYPCYCESGSLITSVTCEKIGNIEHIKKVLQTTKGLNITFGFYNVRFGDIPSDFFEGQKTEDLNFDNCKIGSFGDKPFSGLENTLRHLFIYGSVDKRVKDLKTFPLGHLKKLESFYFQGNDIKRVGNEWFEGGPKSLTQVSLEASDIEELGDKAFASLVNVEQFWIGNNIYKVVKRSMFPFPALKISILEMSFSEIETIPEDMFVAMPNLKSINVSGNKLLSLPSNTWAHIWNQLEEVYVDRNRLECDEKVKWIFERKLPKILDGKCYGYNSLRGKKLEELSLKDFA